MIKLHEILASLEEWKLKWLDQRSRLENQPHLWGFFYHFYEIISLGFLWLGDKSTRNYCIMLKEWKLEWSEKRSRLENITSSQDFFKLFFYIFKS